MAKLRAFQRRVNAMVPIPSEAVDIYGVMIAWRRARSSGEMNGGKSKCNSRRQCIIYVHMSGDYSLPWMAEMVARGKGATTTREAVTPTYIYSQTDDVESFFSTHMTPDESKRLTEKHPDDRHIMPTAFDSIQTKLLA